MRPASLFRLVAVLGAVVVALGVTAAAGAVPGAYVVKPLVSDTGGPGVTKDPNLVNAWGLTAGPTTPWWVSDNGTGLSTLYTAAGAIVPLVVDVGDAPTGVVFNGTTGFTLSNGNPARFIFSSEAGVIHGWNGGPKAETLADLSPQGAVFKGLAIASTNAGPRLYATDFHNRRIDVFDGNGQLLRQSFFFFHDAFIPAEYGPFGIQAIGSRIYVTYALTQPGSDDEAHGAGLGYVDAYDSVSGALVARIATRGALNAPWGIALAPPGFGAAAGDILVGNFGDGHINAYRPSGSIFGATPEGTLNGPDGAPIFIDGLWALQFGMGSLNNGPTDSLFFTAGPNDESDGLFGSIRAAS